MKMLVVIDTTGKDDARAAALLKKFVYENSLLIKEAMLHEHRATPSGNRALGSLLKHSPIIGMAGN